MELGFRQSLGMRQNLVMTQSLIQAIKLLQLNHLELVEAINEELMTNPTLEEVPGSGQEAAAEAARLSQPQTAGERREADDRGDTLEGAREGAAEGAGAGPAAGPAEGAERDWGQVLEGLADDRDRQRGSSGVDELPPIEQNLSSGESLADHLEWQLAMQPMDPAVRAAAVAIIYSLDERGWLEGTLEEALAAGGVDAAAGEEALRLVQRLDPVGCGARDLEECLLVQARFHYPEDANFERLICHHLHDLERKDYKAIARALGMEVEDAQEYHRMLRVLDPMPGRAYTGGDPQYISPDVYIHKVGEEWQIVQNDDGLPKLKVSAYYRRILQSREATKEEREYIRERLGSAEYLLKSLYRRQDTISKVVRAILERQRAFFDYGPEHLRPMILKDIADEIGVHESTVSRVTSSKYLQCPHGLFELKYFFNAGLGGSDGVTAEVVKQRIRRIIQAEDRARPLSDEAIAQILQREGVDIARRTVAKYREALGIPPVSRRK